MKAIEPDMRAIRARSLSGIKVWVTNLIEPDTAYLIGGDAILVPKHDRYGYLTNILPRPLYTRYTLGAHEAARDRRRSREAARDRRRW